MENRDNIGAMAGSRWRQAEEQFHLALEKSPGDRTLFLRQLDDDLRTEVAALIEAFEASEATRDHVKAAPAPLGPLRKIGPYTVLEQLGEGGMGAVYLAERTDAQFEKKVAIKLIRPGPGSVALLDRFYKERQILAGLEHAYIARLLDGGATEDGQPFLVMEYVDGQRFDKYCDERKLEIRARLELFRRVCEAVNYAHQRLVVHRDLKPNNIMVTREGEPRLLDFGVAKMVKSESAGGEMTATMGLFFTPLYASPELLCGHHTTVSSDVYSLGVILYQTLTGRLPHDEHALSPGELISAVITRDPQRPSTSAGQTLEHEDTPEQLAAKRGVTPEKLQKILRGDLDGIVLRALAKNPAERYASVEQLTDDIDRYLTGRPVLAVEATPMYAARKFVKRHRWGVMAAALFLLSLVGGLASTLWQARVARQQTVEANLRFNDARTLANYLLFDLYGSVKKLPGSTPVQAEMADRTLSYLDRLAAAKSQDRSLRVELARGYLQLGDILGNPFGPNLGQTVRSLDVYRKGLAIIEPVATASPGDKEAQVALARTRQQLAGTLVFMGKPAEGIPHAREATKRFNQLAEAYPDDVEVLLSAGLADQFLARNLSQQHGWVEAAAEGDEVTLTLNRSVTRLRRAITLAPKQGRPYQMLAGTLQVMGNVRGVFDPSRSMPYYRDALAVLDEPPVGERLTKEARNMRASVLQNFAWDLGKAKDYAQCQAKLKEATDVLREISDADPKDLAALYHVAIPLRTAGIYYAYAGNLPAAIANYREAIDIYNRLVPMDPANRIYPMYRAEVGARAASLAARTGNVAEAARFGIPALEYLEKRADDPAAGLQALLDAARWRVEIAAPPMQDYARALSYARRADQVAKGKSEDALIVIATTQWNLGQREDAIATVRRGLETVAAPAPGEKPSAFRAEFERMLADYQAKAKTPGK